MSVGTLSKESSIYQYTLIKRVYHRPYFPVLFVMLTFITALVLWLLGKNESVLLFFAAFMFVHAGHVLSFARLSKHSTSSWVYVRHFPWLGLVPKTYTPLSFVWIVHIRLFIIGLCVCLLTVPWLPITLSSGFVFFHLALLFPRIVILAILRRKHQDGIVRIDKQHVSLYKS